ncbi:MAG: preprotein translocase subunit SecE [Chromatiales bacterium]|jgi:preprotein translocase subunit SecE
MVGKAETQSSGLDTAKLSLAIALLVAAVAAFYYYADESLLMRVVGLLVVVLIAAGISLTSVPGRRLWSFLQDARNEVRKMVWPTRAETLQTTLIVIVVVIIVGIFLWLLDMFLGWAVKLLIGHGG